MLYGMAEPIKEALVSLRQRVRVYTPYGQLIPGMAYLVRRLLENTSDDSFLRASFTEHVPEEQLLMNPLVKIAKRTATSEAVYVSRFRNEPLADFSREVNREAMEQALRDLQPFLG